MPNKQEGPYFSHDYTTRSDPKIKNLIRKHKMEGYGVWWSIVEDLYINANALPLDCEGIAYDMRTETELVRSVINDFGLFEIKENIICSASVQRRLDIKKAKSLKARESADIGWEQRKRKSNAKRSHSDRNASKVKESKVNNINTPIVPKEGEGVNFEKKINNGDIKKLPPPLKAVPNTNFNSEQFNDPEEKIPKAGVLFEMMTVFKKHYPGYPEDPENDYQALLKLAFKIATKMGWDKNSVKDKTKNGVVFIWGKVVEFMLRQNKKLEPLVDIEKWEWSRALGDMVQKGEKISYWLNNGANGEVEKIFLGGLSVPTIPKAEVNYDKYEKKIN